MKKIIPHCLTALFCIFVLFLIYKSTEYHNDVFIDGFRHKPAVYKPINYGHKVEIFRVNNWTGSKTLKFEMTRDEYNQYLEEATLPEQNPCRQAGPRVDC